MSKNLTSFLKEYEAAYPEDVVRIDKAISANQEITSIVLQLEQQNKHPLLIFSNVINAEGKQAEPSLVTNVSSSRVRIARICNSTYEALGRDLYEATRVRRQEPVVMAKTEAPVREVVKRGDQINLLEFPAVCHSYMDIGYYFPSGFLTTYDPVLLMEGISAQCPKCHHEFEPKSNLEPRVTEVTIDDILVR